MRAYRPRGGWQGAFSGGKDSLVIKWLAKRAGEEVRWQNNFTTIDPAELTHYNKRHHPDVEVIRPAMHLVAKMVEKGLPPTRGIRWCCDIYKERPCQNGQAIITGVRAEESRNRANNWSYLTLHKRSNSYHVLPILNWTEKQVWELIHAENLPYCCLYDQGQKRVGCVGCPLNPQARVVEFERWPGFKRMWHNGFVRMWDRHNGRITRRGTEWFGSALYQSVERLWEVR
jgi:phosphoadenosine phosphosulfate reductase